MVIENKDIDLTINIDNDNIDVSFAEMDEDDDTFLQFEEFVFYALETLLKAMNINAEMV